MANTFVATDPMGYERFMGRWSQRLAPAFVEFVGVQPGERVLDVGSGTGNLTFALAQAGGEAVGLDPSTTYVEFARRRTPNPGVRFDVGDGTALPYEDATFDRSLSMLTLDVVPDPVPILAEMCRVTRSGGTVSGLVNDFRCGFTAFTILWDTAAVLDRGIADLRDHLMSKRIGLRGGLADLWRAAGLTAIHEGQLSIPFEYESFSDYWSSFTGGQGKIGPLMLNLPESTRREIEQYVRAAYLCGLPDGARAFTTMFWVVRGLVAG